MNDGAYAAEGAIVLAGFAALAAGAVIHWPKGRLVRLAQREDEPGPPAS